MKKTIFFVFLCISILGFAHPMPNSIIFLDVHPEKINCELQIPIKELQPAVVFDISSHPTEFLKNHHDELQRYLLKHFKIKDQNGHLWNVTLQSVKVENAEQNATGTYQELVIHLLLSPPKSGNVRNFTLLYDLIIHQVVTHRALLLVRQDWETGKTGNHPSEIRTIAVNTKTLQVDPIKVHLEKGNHWKGFKSMVQLGIKHISEGTDHLMFLIVLLLTAPLIAFGKKWKTNPNPKKSIINIFKITLAFTIGHSITLILATLGWISFPIKPIEIAIAFSIFISAIHVIVPFFPNKESVIAGFFGFIHGLAFSNVLSELHLSSWRLAISLFGFNLGIEIMQLFVVVMTLPWLLFLSRHSFYIMLKDILAFFAIVTSVIWIIERITGKDNFCSSYLNLFAQHSILFVVLLFLISVFTLIFKTIKAN